MLYLTYEHFDYTDAWKEIQILGREVIDMDDEHLIDECKCVNVGKNETVDKIIERFEHYGLDILPPDRQYLIGYYILSYIEEVLEV